MKNWQTFEEKNGKMWKIDKLYKKKRKNVTNGETLEKKPEKCDKWRNFRKKCEKLTNFRRKKRKNVKNWQTLEEKNGKMWKIDKL